MGARPAALHAALQTIILSCSTNHTELQIPTTQVRGGGGTPRPGSVTRNSKGPESFTRNFWFSSTKDQKFSEFPCLVPEMVLCISASTKDEELEKHRTKQQEFRVMNIAARGIIYKEER